MKSLSFKALSFAFTISFLGILSTYYLSKLVQIELKTKSHLNMESIARQVSISFQDALDISFNDLQALQAFYSANQHQLSKAEFNEYMQIIEIKKRHYIQALSWVPLVSNNKREEFEKRMKAQQPDFKITQRNTEGKLIKSESADFYTPVTYITPYEENKSAQGFDLSSNETRKKSLQHARDSGDMTITAKIKLVQEKASSFGFLIIAPVFKKNEKITNKEERRKALLGYVTGVFRIDSLMENAQEQATREGLTLTLSDLNKENGGILYGEQSIESDFTYKLTIPNRHWNLNLSITKQQQKIISSSSISNWILLAGVIISLLLGTSIYALKVSINRSFQIKRLGKELQSQNMKLETKVIERTELLAEKNDELNKRIDELTKQRAIMDRLMKESEEAKTSAEQRAIELARSNKDLDDFAYVASHDLKAPLRGIMQLSSWIEEDIEEFANDDTKSNLKLLMNRISRLEKLLEDLLNYSRIGRKKGDITLIDSKEIVLNIFDLQDSPDNVTLVCQKEMPTFNTRSAPFETILRNLIGNAIKHNSDTGCVITVNAQEYTEYYEFSVRDDGKGIPEEYHEQIFELFKTLQPRDEVEGSGMGLSIIKKLLSYQNGTIKIESDGKNGTCFIFTWPKIKVNKEEL